LHLKSLFVSLVILTFSIVVPYIAQSVESPADLTEMSLDDLVQVATCSSSKLNRNQIISNPSKLQATQAGHDRA